MADTISQGKDKPTGEPSFMFSLNFPTLMFTCRDVHLTLPPNIHTST